MAKTPEQVGFEALVNTGLVDKIPVDVDDLARRLGVEVRDVPPERLLDWIKDDPRHHLEDDDVRRRFQAVIRSQGRQERPLVLVRSDLSPWKRRMVLGHELGHRLSDDEPLRAPDCRPALEARFKTTSNAYIRFEQRRAEIYADRVGRALLMNRTVFSSDVRTYNLIDLARKYQVPLRDVVDYAVTLDICPMTRVFGWYERKKRCLHRLDPLFSPSATVRLRQAFHVLQGSVKNLASVIRIWIDDRNHTSHAHFEVQGHQFGIAVYNHAKSSNLILLVADTEDLRRNQLQFGIFRQLRELLQ